MACLDASIPASNHNYIYIYVYICDPFEASLLLGFLSTLLLELGFNDLRSNEQRGARHKQRSNVRLQALLLSSMRRWYPTASHVVVNDSDMDRFDDLCVKADVFKAADGPSTPAQLGVSLEGIQEGSSRKKKGDFSNWTTSVAELEAEQLCLMRAIEIADVEHWPQLWLAGLFRKHMIISKPVEEGIVPEYLYVLSAGSWFLWVLQLLNFDGGLRIDPSPHMLREVTVGSIGEYAVHNYSMRLEWSFLGATVIFTDKGPQDLIMVIAQHYMHLLKVDVLKKLLLEMTGTKLPGRANQLQLVQAILDSAHVLCNCPEGQSHSDSCLRCAVEERVKILMAKRARKKKTPAASVVLPTAEQEGQEDDDDADDEEAQDDDDIVAAVGAGLTPAAVSMCPGDMGFLLGGEHQGNCINEEDGDEGMNFVERETAKRKAEEQQKKAEKDRQRQAGTARQRTSRPAQPPSTHCPGGPGGCAKFNKALRESTCSICSF